MPINSEQVLRKMNEIQSKGGKSGVISGSFQRLNNSTVGRRYSARSGAGSRRTAEKEVV